MCQDQVTFPGMEAAGRGVTANFSWHDGPYRFRFDGAAAIAQCRGGGMVLLEIYWTRNDSLFSRINCTHETPTEERSLAGRTGNNPIKFGICGWRSDRYRPQRPVRRGALPLPAAGCTGAPRNPCFRQGAGTRLPFGQFIRIPSVGH